MVQTFLFFKPLKKIWRAQVLARLLAGTCVRHTENHWIKVIIFWTMNDVIVLWVLNEQYYENHKERNIKVKWSRPLLVIWEICRKEAISWMFVLFFLLNEFNFLHNCWCVWILKIMPQNRCWCLKRPRISFLVNLMQV